MNTQRIIIVYEEVPELTTIYDCEIKDQETLDKLLMCHGHLGGVVDCPDDHPVVEWLPKWLEGQQEHIVYKSDLSEQKPLKVDTLATIVVTGFMC